MAPGASVGPGRPQRWAEPAPEPAGALARLRRPLLPLAALLGTVARAFALPRAGGPSGLPRGTARAGLLAGERARCHAFGALPAHARCRSAATRRAEPDDDWEGGSILERLAELDREEELEARDVLDVPDDEESAALTSGLQRQAEELKLRHERAMDMGRQRGHAPVLLNAAMGVLFPASAQQDKFDGNYVDATFGRGGHTREMLSRIGEDGRVFAFDVDPTAVEVARELEQQDKRLTFFHRPYAEMADVLADQQIHGVILDIGISSPQIDDKGRGFSLQNLAVGPERPLDLRMNPTAGISASDWLAGVSVEELAWVLDEYGEDFGDPVMAERLAQAILDEQELNGPYTSMRRFAEVVVRTKALHAEDFEHPVQGLEHPAKLTVQAIRLFLNQELEQLREGLGAALKLLVPGGRCLAAAFKRRESSIIKKFLFEHQDPDPQTVSRVGASRRLRELYPLVGTDLEYAVKLVGKPLGPSQEEVAGNSRSRSGCLFVLEKVPRLSRQVRAKPRLVRNRFREPPRVPLIDEAAHAA